ncbi:MAG: divalent metal cation transporter, partial [Pseudonocardia sp.]|nr:divalent metal cation transporter [Pseudonocardia sp.]
GALADQIVAVVVTALLTAMVLMTAAVTLHRVGIVPKDVSELAIPLEPLACPSARYIFAVGLFAASLTSLIGSPLMGSTILVNGIWARYAGSGAKACEGHLHLRRPSFTSARYGPREGRQGPQPGGRACDAEVLRCRWARARIARNERHRCRLSAGSSWRVASPGARETVIVSARRGNRGWGSGDGACWHARWFGPRARRDRAGAVDHSADLVPQLASGPDLVDSPRVQIQIVVSGRRKIGKYSPFVARCHAWTASELAAPARAAVRSGSGSVLDRPDPGRRLRVDPVPGHPSVALPVLHAADPPGGGQRGLGPERGPAGGARARPPARHRAEDAVAVVHRVGAAHLGRPVLCGQRDAQGVVVGHPVRAVERPVQQVAGLHVVHLGVVVEPLVVVQTFGGHAAHGVLHLLRAQKRLGGRVDPDPLAPAQLDQGLAGHVEVVKDPGVRRGHQQVELALEGAQRQRRLQLAVQRVEQVGEPCVDLLQRFELDPDPAAPDRVQHLPAGQSGAVARAPGPDVVPVVGHRLDLDVGRVDGVDQRRDRGVGEHVPVGQRVPQLHGMPAPQRHVAGLDGVQYAVHGVTSTKSV